MHNSESFWRIVDRPKSDERHAMLVDVVNEWNKDVFGTLASYLSEYKQYPDWLCRGLIAAYMAFRDEARRINRVEYVEDAEGRKTEVDAMEKWIFKHYPSGFDEKSCGFAKFSSLLDEHPV